MHDFSDCTGISILTLAAHDPLLTLTCVVFVFLVQEATMSVNLRDKRYVVNVAALC